MTRRLRLIKSHPSRERAATTARARKALAALLTPEHWTRENPSASAAESTAYRDVYGALRSLAERDPGGTFLRWVVDL